MNIFKPSLVPEEWRATKSGWAPDGELARALILRGAILWSYSHVEQRLTELAIECSGVEEYWSIADRFPFHPSKRSTYLRKVFDTPGPLSRFRPLGVAVLNRFDASRDTRNQMAHAEMEVMQGLVRFTERMGHEGEVLLRVTPYYPGELERLAVKAARFSKATQRLHQTMLSSAEKNVMVMDEEWKRPDQLDP